MYRRARRSAGRRVLRAGLIRHGRIDGNPLRPVLEQAVLRWHAASIDFDGTLAN